MQVEGSDRSGGGEQAEVEASDRRSRRATAGRGARSQVEASNGRWRGVIAGGWEGNDHRWRRATAGGGERSQVEAHWRGASARLQLEASDRK
jgi:hypothetical protein